MKNEFCTDDDVRDGGGGVIANCGFIIKQIVFFFTDKRFWGFLPTIFCDIYSHCLSF